MAKDPPPKKHFITSPKSSAIDEIPAVDHPSEGVDYYYIDADGKPDSDATKFIEIVEVYGKAFAAPADVPNNQTDIKDMIKKRLIGNGNGCVAGTAFAVNSVWQYKFRDGSPDYNPVPVPNIDSDQNWLQVWVLFKGDTDYTRATNRASNTIAPVQFKPTS